MSTTVARSNQLTGRSRGSVIVQDYQTPTYAASIAITTLANAEETIVKVALTGNLTLTVGTTNPLIGDKLILILSSDSTARTITYSTGFATTSTSDTLAVSSTGTAMFRYNGDTWDKVSSINPSGTPGGSGSSPAVTYASPAYAATLALTPAAGDSRYTVGQLTGAMTINITTTNLSAGNIVSFVFSADGTNRVVTFGTGMKSSGTMTVVASKFGGISFQYDGTQLVALGREITA